MTIPSTYRKSPIINANFDWVDIANGIGYEVYYGGASGTTTMTSSNIFYSEDIHLNGTSIDMPTNTETEMLDTNFDITFNIPKKIKGDILITIPYGIVNTEESANNIDDVTYLCSTSIYHYDGSTETQMGNTITSGIRTVNPDGQFSQNDVRSHITTLKIPVPLTNFKSGETIRITIKVLVKHKQGSDRRMLGGIGCDPRNRTDANIFIDFTATPISDEERATQETDKPTNLIFQIPFKIDL